MQTLLFNVLGSFAQRKHMGRPGQSDKVVQQALKLFQERATNNMSVNDIVKVTGVPRSTIYAKQKRVNH